VDDRWRGRRLGNYALEGPIGCGGMATVYRASHVALGTSHAVKVLDRGLAQIPDVRARFLREGRVQAQFTHPGIARVTDTIHVAHPDGGDPAVALVMELLDGRSLKEVLDEGPLDAGAALLVLDEAADALAYAHARGVVHRDIKPGNLFLARTSEGSLRTMILDFGVARHQSLSDLTGTGVMLGTTHYMAPEQVDDPRKVDARADVFSLGVVLFEMLVGEPPHEGLTPTAVALAILSGRHRRLAAVLPELVALDPVIARALLPDPDSRYATPPELAAAARDAVREPPATGRPVPPSDRVPFDAPTWPPVPDALAATIRGLRATGVSLRPCAACAAPVPPGASNCRRCGARAG
jgi:serine/threonine protein kinase